MRLLEFVYIIGYYIKKSLNLKNQERLPCRVISVGNITTGGTGKTPAVIAIAEEAKKCGYQPCILTRGYKGKSKGPCFVSRGSGPLIGADEAGDEALLMAERLKDVPIVKCKNRYDGGIFAIKRLSLQSPVFILDDGFQHWKLYRDMDILLVDSTNPFGNSRLLPLGILREPLREMERADVIVITRTDMKQTPELEFLTEDIRRYNSDAPIFLSEHRPTYVRTLSGEKLPIAILSDKTVFGFCGIGNPSSFKDTLKGVSAGINGMMIFNDHYKYDQHDILQIGKTAGEHGADWIVTTGKDIMRLRGFELPDNLVSLDIEFNVTMGFYDEVFRRV